MGLKIKTSIWEEKDPEKLKKVIGKMNTIGMMMAGAVIVNELMFHARSKSVPILIIAGSVGAIGLLIMVSYWKHTDKLEIMKIEESNIERSKQTKLNRG